MEMLISISEVKQAETGKYLNLTKVGLKLLMVKEL